MSSTETAITFKITEHEDGSVSFTEADPISLYNAKIVALAYANTFVHGCKLYMQEATGDGEIVSMLTTLADFKSKFDGLVDQVGAEWGSHLSEETKERLNEMVDLELTRETLH